MGRACTRVLLVRPWWDSGVYASSLARGLRLDHLVQLGYLQGVPRRLTCQTASLLHLLRLQQVQHRQRQSHLPIRLCTIERLCPVLLLCLVAARHSVKRERLRSTAPLP